MNRLRAGRVKAPNPVRLIGSIGAAIIALVAALFVSSSLQPAASEARRTKTVVVGDIFFRPAKTTVRRGTRVRWVWRGRLRHNVTVVRGPSRFRSRTKRSGSFSRTLRRRGRYRLICTIHGADLMSMRIRVR